jgi:single-strand DNA-binding protein
MAALNKVMLMGNLTRDPQLKFLPSQTQVCEFGLATSRKFKTATGEEREEVLFVDITAFGRTAEVINQYFTKGKPIFIEGRLKYDQWEDKNGGGKRSKLTVVVDNFQFIGGRDGPGGGGGYESEGGGGGEYDQRPAARPPTARPPVARPASAARPPAGRPAPAQPPAEPPFGDEPQIDEGDIPF